MNTIKRYRAIFSSFHTLYRFSTSLSDHRNFIIGVGRLYKNVLKAEKIVVITKLANSHGFLKFQLHDNKQTIRRGGISILTKREREILNRNKEVIFDNRLIYPFIFYDTLGVVYIKRNSASDMFDDVDKRWFIALSEQVSVYLRIFNLYQEQNKFLVSYIKSLTGLLDKYIPTSFLHGKSISRLIRAMGKELKLTITEIRSLEYASLLHDAGKLQIPSSLLEKQSPLTDQEFQMIMKHPTKGVELIKDLSSLKPAIPIILHHHERYDGKGYPARLKKGEIPLGARILAVIDAFDAMYFGRPYRRGRNLESVEKEIKNESGKQFDPRIVAAFLKILKRKSLRNYLMSFH